MLTREYIESNLLPDGYDHKFEDISEISGSKSNGTKLIIRMKPMTETELEKWRLDFQSKSKSTWGVRKTTPNPMKAEFSKQFVCHHSSFDKTVDRKYTARNKNYSCEAKMHIKVRSAFIYLHS